MQRQDTLDYFWKKVPFGFKMFFLTTLAFNIIGMALFPQILIYTCNIPFLTIKEMQIWRLFITFLPAGFEPLAFVNIILDFLINFWMWPQLQKRMSTSYIIIEIFIQNFLIQVTFTIVASILYMLNIGSIQLLLVSLGWYPLVIHFLIRRASQNPNEYISFCFLPRLVKMKYITSILLIVSWFLANELFLSILISFILGHLQFFYLKRRFIKLPLSVYKKLDAILPKRITNRSDFIDVSQSLTYLRGQYCCSNQNNQQGQNNYQEEQNKNNNNNNQFNRNIAQLQNNQQSQVQLRGEGVRIGGNANDFQGIWANRNQNN